MTEANKLAELMQEIGYFFNDTSLLERALRHRSAGSQHNERLEFLGDAVLSLIIANELYNRHPRAEEGSLSRMRSSLVNGEILAKFAEQLGIGPYLSLGHGEKKSGGQKRQSILSDALEAIIGAIYLDGGMEPCCNCVLKWYGKQVDDLATIRPKQDPKSQLQEWAQAHKFSLPIYEIKISGQAHAQIFYAICRVEGLHYIAEGESTSRRKAEQMAARNFLDLIL